MSLIPPLETVFIGVYIFNYTNYRIRGVIQTCPLGVIRTLEQPALCTKVAHKAINERLAKDRWLYNHLLEQINKHYDTTKETLGFFDCCAKLKTLRETDTELAKYNVSSQRFVL